MLFKGNSSSLQLIIEKLQSNKEHNNCKDTPGSEGASYWVSEERTTPPGSSCATPNSITEAPDSEILFTVGVTDGTPYACRFCDKAFSKQSYLKKHEQTHADYMPFRCEYCRRLFKHKRSRDRHIKLHTGDRKYKCTQCEAAFSRSDHLKIHMKTHDHQKPFQCTVCNRGYNTAAALTSHMQNHKRSSETFSIPGPPGTTFKCLQCSEIFRKPEELQAHMNSHPISDTISNSGGRSKSSSNPPIRLTCKYCTKDNFATMELLRSHVQSVHKSVAIGEPMTNNGKPPSTPNSLSPPKSLNSSPAYYCELCTMRFISLQALKKHTAYIHAGSSNAAYNSRKFLSIPPEPINSGKLDCLYCSIHFPTPASFAEHFLIFHAPYHPHLLGYTPPEQIKPTDLSVGSKTSAPSKRSTTRDEQMSATARKKFKTINSTIPPNNPYRYNFAGPLICNQCLAAFADFQSFRAHIKLHIEGTNGGLLGGAKPIDLKRTPTDHMCPHCRSVFPSAEEATHHVVGHFLTTTIGYNCEICNRTFTKADELKEHLMGSHTRIVYNCTICNEMFDSKVTIQMHFTSRHSTEKNIYSCTGCPATKTNIYHSESELATHVKSIHSNISFNNDRTVQETTCLICHMTFSDALDMQLHLSSHAKQFQCPICIQSFPVEYLLDKHIQTYHSPPPNSHNDEDSGVKDLSPRQSPGSRYSSPIKKEQNEETSADNFKYSENNLSNANESMASSKGYKKRKSFGWSFNNSSNKIEEGKLSSKSKSNSSIDNSPTTVKTKSFNCSNNNAKNCGICTKSEFTFETELQSHKKLLHRQETSSTILCPECSRKFDNITALEFHLASIHTKNYQPTKRQPTFDNENEIQLHVDTHVMNGQECRLCRAELPTPIQLQAHLIEHNFNGCAAFSCYLCQSVFPTAQALQTHILEHGTSARPYDCNRCNEKFFFSSELEHHNYVHLGEMATIEVHSPSSLNRNVSDEEENESAVEVEDECILHNDYDSEDEQIDVVTTKTEDNAKQND